jgi:signal transduction histidine kinase
MTSGSRRVLLYWVLLLPPTLAVGGGVLWLLGREQARLDAQTFAAAETRREAVGARARLIAENVELLVGDVQSGLMATLREVPTHSRRDSFLVEWRKTNPLVRGTFVLIDGRVTPTALKPEQAWLEMLQAQGAPWEEKTVAQADLDISQSQVLSQATNNAQQVNITRYNLQEASKLKGGFVPPVERTGWLPWRERGALHVIGWREQNDGTVVGVEVELKQVAAGLGAVLPEGREPGEVYELREIGGEVYQQKTLSLQDRAVSALDPLITVPISEAVLPGWEVAGFLAEDPAGMSGTGLFTLSAVLAGGLVAAILVGGTLLMRQARRSEEEAAQKTSFVANVSHEFKTPLTTIRLYAELLEQGRVADESKRAEYLRTIGRETLRLARLVNNVLDFSRLEQGGKRIERVELNLTTELGHLLDVHALRVADSGIKLMRELPTAPLIVETDRDALGQILINLLDNACKYAASGGEVSVTLAAFPDDPACHLISDKPVRAVVRVGDRGPGVPAEHKRRIFEKFHRVDDTLTTERGGAGLGLSIARQLARSLGGDLAYADRPGGGAEFVLTLP